LSRAYDQNDAVTESSDSARISIEVNRSGVYLPFSYEVLGQGVQKSDMVVFTGKASHLRIRCVIPTQNNKQPYMLVLLTKDIGLAGPWGGIQLYQRPASAAGNPQQSASAEQITGGATAPVTSPVSGGGGTTSSGGTFTGGGGGGTGGGGRKQVL
jgi:hypothetical protein